MTFGKKWGRCDITMGPFQMDDLLSYREGWCFNYFLSSTKTIFCGPIQMTFFKVPMGHIKFHLHSSPNWTLYFTTIFAQSYESLKVST